ncbi:MAG: hypothetical protein CL762_02265 [Chloroflexi bacterium]|nr:hypothetical protein [Chloroflexota bacterium]|tara:strand:+ start:15463 stop:16557 length:1095 start_codon:yes stop_codon:yes gene_type:complete
MKIGIVSPYDISKTGGVTNHVLNLANELSGKGNKVSIIAPSSDESFNLENINFLNVGNPTLVKFGSTKAAIAVKFTSILNTRKFLLQNSFDLIHIHEPLVPFVSLCSLIFSKVPVILTFHATFNSNWKFKFWGFLFKDWISKAALRICVSKTAGYALKNYGYDINYEIIPNGVDIERFKISKSNLNQELRILFVGRNEDRKGIKILLEAFKIVIRKHSNVTLNLVGEGVSSLSNKYANISNCKFYDHMEGDELVGMYHRSQIFCSPAIENESFGIVLLEAMASGLVVVASDIEGYRGLVNNYENGILFKNRDYEGLARIFCELIENRYLINKLSLNGMHFSKRYSWKEVSQEIILNYEKRVKIG